MPSDFQNDFSAGQHNGISPFLSRSSYHAGVNVSGRRGFLETRQADTEIALTQSITARYQGSEVYNPGTGDRVVTVCGGNLYEIWPTGQVNQLTTAPVLSTLAERCYFIQANNFLIIQDGINIPVVLEEAHIKEDHDVPIGRWMTAGNGYLAIVSSNCRSIFVSSISTFLEDPEVILDFTDQPGTLTPFNIGDIVGLQLAPILDAGTSMGDLLAFGSNGRVYAYDLTIPRDQWATTAGFGRTIAEGLFLASNASVRAVGGDLYMRTHNGIDTLNLARADWQSSRNRSISKPIDGWLNQDPPHLLRVCSGAFWDGRYYVTTQPIMRLDTPEIIHGGLAVYDASHGLKEEPAYPGIERGTYPVDLHVIAASLYTLSKGLTGGLSLHRRLGAGDHHKSAPAWRVDTRAFDWDQPKHSKSLRGRTSYFHVDFGCPGTIEVYFRVDGSPNWVKLTELKAEVCPDKAIYQIHSDPFGLPSLPESAECGRLQGRSFRWIQFRLQGSVPAKIREIHLDADLDPEPKPLEINRVSRYLTHSTHGLYQ